MFPAKAPNPENSVLMIVGLKKKRKSLVKRSVYLWANYFWKYFGGIPFTRESYEENIYDASVNLEFGSTLARRLNQRCISAVLQSNLMEIIFDPNYLTDFIKFAALLSI